VALGGEIVDLVGAGVLQQANEVGGVGHVSVMKKEGRPTLMRIDVDVIDAPGIERRRAPRDAVAHVALVEKKTRE